MLRVAVAIPLGTFLMLMGQAEGAAGVLPYAELALQGGALAILAWAVWYAYQTVIPELRKEIQEDRTRYTESLDRMNTGFQKTLDVMADRHERREDASANRFEKWELQRHEDSEKLESTLSAMTINCAEARSQLRER